MEMELEWQKKKETTTTTNEILHWMGLKRMHRNMVFSVALSLTLTFEFINDVEVQRWMEKREEEMRRRRRLYTFTVGTINTFKITVYSAIEQVNVN